MIFARRVPIKIFSIIAGSFLLTLLLSHFLGKPIEHFETVIYQKVTGKTPQHFEFDTSGVPYVVYQGPLGKQYNTVAVAEYAIRLSNSNDTFKSQIFFNCINWLIRNGNLLNDSSLLFLNKYDWPGYGMTAPWRSAMNQGRAMQAFIRAYKITGDSIYLDYAVRSMNVLYTKVGNGGVTYIDSSGYWFEEYADDDAPQSRVLNGMIVVLQALSDFNKVANDTGSFFLFTEGVSSVKNSLHLYDNNGHSNYDVLGKPASPWYHKFHIRQLEFLIKETRDPFFVTYLQKWQLYKEPGYLSTLISKPTRIGVFAVFTLFIIVVIGISVIYYIASESKWKV